MNKLFFFLSILSFNFSYSQDLREKCKLGKTYFEELYKVDANAIKCLSKNSDKKNTIFLTFARWCAPCMWHLNGFMKLQENYNVDLYILLVDKENSNMAYLAKEYAFDVFPKAKIAIISDVEGRGKSKKYRKFLDEITPKQFENIDDMSKYIVLDNNGEIKLVTSYKDDNGTDWKDDSAMVKRLVEPLLEKKQ